MKNVSINGTSIPNEQACPWCGGIMERRGGTYMGSGTNSFTLWCDDCGAIQHNARNYSRKIKNFDVNYKFEDV